MLDSIKYYSTIDLIPRCCDDPCISVMLLDHIYDLKKLLLSSVLASAENNGSAGLYLIQEELSEVLDIHFSLGNINNSCCTVKLDIDISRCLLNRLDNV